MFSLGDGSSGKILVNKRSNLYALGDSITVGQAASDWQTTKLKTYIGLLKTALNSSIFTNWASGGTGVFYACKSASANLNANIMGIISIMSGFNDLRYSGNTSTMISKITGAYRFIISSALVSKFISPVDALWTSTGDWTYYSGGVALGGRSTTYRTTVGGTKSGTITARNLTFNFIGSNNAVNYQFGSVKVTIDGVERFNITLNDKTDGLLQDYPGMPYSVNVFGLSNSAHTVLVETTGDVMFCDISVLEDYDIANTVFVLTPTYCTSSGWSSGAPANNGSNLAVNSVRTALNSVYDEYKNQGFNVLFSDSSKYFDVNSNLDTDGIHPIDSGMQNIYRSIREGFNFDTTLLIFSNRTNIAYSTKRKAYVTKLPNGSGYTGKSLSDYYLPANTDGHITIDIPNQTDADFGLVGFNTTKEDAVYTNYEYGVQYTDAYATVSTKALTNGVTGSNLIPGYLAVNSKLRFGRFAGRIKIQYASDGINFVDTYDSWGVNNVDLYLSLNMLKNTSNKCLYNPILTNFSLIP